MGVISDVANKVGETATDVWEWIKNSPRIQRLGLGSLLVAVGSVAPIPGATVATIAGTNMIAGVANQTIAEVEAKQGELLHGTMEAFEQYCTERGIPKEKMIEQMTQVFMTDKVHEQTNAPAQNTDADMANK